MSEKIARFKQFEYRATSNLVLMAERTGSRVNEPTGEPESLWGKMKGSMGDRAIRSAAPVKHNLEKFRKRAKDNMKTESQILKKVER